MPFASFSLFFFFHLFSFLFFFFFFFFSFFLFCFCVVSPSHAVAGYPTKAKHKAAPTPYKSKTPSKFRPVKKSVNYERQMGQVPMGGPYNAPPPGGRKHSDTLASMPMSEKMKAFESHSAADARRSMWLKKAEEKKGHKPKAPKGKAPTPPAKRTPATPKRIPVNAAGSDYRQSVRASPAGVANLRSQFQPGTRSPKAAPRKAAPKPPAAKRVAKKPTSAAPPKKAVPSPDDLLRQQEEAELAAFEAEQAAARVREERAKKAAAEEERKRRAAEQKRQEMKRQEEAERKRRAEEEEKRRQEAERKRLEEEERRRVAAQTRNSQAARAVEVLISIADFEGNPEDGELSFAEDECILLMKRDDTGWWQGDIGGQIGWFPSNFIRETEKDEYESYCRQWDIEPYFEPEPVVVKAPPKTPTTRPKKSPARAAAAPAAATGPAMSKEKCGQCKKLFTVAELEKATTIVDKRIHPKCITAYRKAQGDLKKLQFGKLPNSMDEFEIQGLLGKGRFGKVYQCRKIDNGKIYAIKVSNSVKLFLVSLFFFFFLGFAEESY